MALSNAERQKKWRDKRNELAKTAAVRVLPKEAKPGDPPKRRIKVAHEFLVDAEHQLFRAIRFLAGAYAYGAADHPDQKAFKHWLIDQKLEAFDGATVDRLTALGKAVMVEIKGGKSCGLDLDVGYSIRLIMGEWWRQQNK